VLLKGKKPEKFMQNSHLPGKMGEKPKGDVPMALPPEQENKTRRRAEILDADYVPREDVPNTPRTIGEDRSRRGGSPATAVTLCIALLALALAVSRGDGSRQDKKEEELPAVSREARWEMTVSGLGEEADTRSEKLLGAAVETLSGPVAAYYSLKDCPQVPGVQVCALEPDGSAAAAGILPGDVIIGLDDVEFLTEEELSRELSLRAGREITLRVYRMGETLELTARLPQEDGAEG
jgi:hypothetical protein